MMDTEGKIQDLLNRVVEESKKNKVDHKLQEKSVIISKRKRLRFELQIEDINVKQL